MKWQNFVCGTIKRKIRMNLPGFRLCERLQSEEFSLQTKIMRTQVEIIVTGDEQDENQDDHGSVPGSEMVQKQIQWPEKWKCIPSTQFA
jgi:hypothetical protein